MLMETLFRARPRRRKRAPQLLIASVLFVVAGRGWTIGSHSPVITVDDLHFQLSVTVAWMLLGAVAFMMALFYLVNNSDKEIRMYSWQVISSTINIFCAVLIFSASNRLVEHYAFEEIPNEMRHLHAFAICVDFAHMLFWMIMMVCVLWFAAVCKQKVAESEDSEHRHELDVKCWAMLFAHVAGFAAINCFGDLQQLFFSGSATQSELAVPISASCLFFLCWLAEQAAQRLYKADLKELEDGVFELWEEQTHEAENDIAALCLSFLICQSLRYHTGGQLPDPEGNEPPATRAAVLLLCSVIFAAVAVVSVQLTDLKLTTIRRMPRSKRLMDVFQLICCMCCAWCSYYGGKRLYTSVAGDNIIEIMTRIVLSIMFSILAFLLVLMMNRVVDRNKMSEAKNAQELREDVSRMRRKNSSRSGSKPASRSLSFADNVQLMCLELEHNLVLGGSRTIIKAMAILVGFSWEEAFEGCVSKACERTTIIPPHLAEAVLAALLAGMILPAWRMYIVPNCEIAKSA